MRLNVSEWGLNLIQFISNLYVGVFLQIAGIVSISCMLEKDCNGNPISTVPPCYAFQMIFPLYYYIIIILLLYYYYYYDFPPRLIQSRSRNVCDKKKKAL